MKISKVFRLIAMTLTFLSLMPARECHILTSREFRPLCAAQFSLVNSYCSALPFVRKPPTLNDDGDEEHRHGHRHHHHHQHRELNDQEEGCCRWAKAVDSKCVCEVLILGRMPTFLLRPSHQYKLTIGESCEITYSCGGPM